MANDLSFTISSSLTAVPYQDVTLTVAPSSNFSASGYLYQWKAGGTNVSGAVASLYKFDAPTSAGDTTYTCAVSGLTGSNVFVFAKTTGNIVTTVKADTSTFARHIPKGNNILKESGLERFKRIRNMGYC